MHFPHLLNVAGLTTLLVWLWRYGWVRFIPADFPERRGRACVLILTARRRMRDLHPCWQFLVWGCWVRVAILAVHKAKG